MINLGRSIGPNRRPRSVIVKKKTHTLTINCGPQLHFPGANDLNRWVRSSRNLKSPFTVHNVLTKAFSLSLALSLMAFAMKISSASSPSFPVSNSDKIHGFHLKRREPNLHFHAPNPRSTSFRVSLVSISLLLVSQSHKQTSGLLQLIKKICVLFPFLCLLILR